MALNIAKLDQELEALEKRVQLIQDIKRLAADPDAKPLLEALVLNGTGPEAPPPTSRLPLRPTNEYASLSQIDSVRHAISKHQGQRFVVGGIGDELRAAGVDIDNIQVGRVLRRLEKAEELRIALEGGGNVPNQYEATEHFRTA